ncbi:SET domain-containing protein [Chloropicon primus]|nr:SET domain-containing protein [Chloropicon primus]
MEEAGVKGLLCGLPLYEKLVTGSVECKDGEPVAVVSFDEARGRYLVAGSSLKQGDVVLRSDAFERGILGNYKKRVCSFCFKDAKKRLHIHCRDCEQAWYCSEACREAHKRSGGHSLLHCKILSGFGSSKFNGAMESIIKILLAVLLKRVEAEPSRRGGGGGTGYELFNHLQSHADDLLPRSKKDLKDACSFLRKQMQRHHEEAPLPLDELVHHASRIESNCFGIFEEAAEAGDQGPSTSAEGGEGDAPRGEASGGVNGSSQQQRGPQRDVMLGREVYLEASMFNHSCEPTCVMSRSSGACEVSLLRDVDQGEELTISYIDETKPGAHRRKELKRNYHFDCHCRKCELDLLALRGGKKYNHLHKKKAKKKGKGRASKEGSAGSGGGAAPPAMNFESQVDQAMQKFLAL